MIEVNKQGSPLTAVDTDSKVWLSARGRDGAEGLLLESGIRLTSYHLSYNTYGTLNATADNVVWIFHALTANSKPHEWWDGYVGECKLFDSTKYFIVCVNTTCSCYGRI